MQVTALLNPLDETAADPRRAAAAKLRLTIAGVVLIVNSFALKWAFASSEPAADASAMLGALVLGAPIVANSVRGLRRGGSFGINELVSLAVVAAFASGDYRTAGVVAFFMLLGEIIETRTAAGARAAIESLVRLTPAKARRIVGQTEEEVPASALAVGDVIRVRPGDNIAADGVILSGSGAINEASITGESLPVEKGTATKCSPARSTPPACWRCVSHARAATPPSAACGI